jgi:hypothetical protein
MDTQALTSKFYDLFRMKEYIEDSIRELEKQYMTLSMSVAKVPPVTDIVTTSQLAFKDLKLRNQSLGAVHLENLDQVINKLTTLNETSNIDINRAKQAYQDLVDRLVSSAIQLAVSEKNRLVRAVNEEITNLAEKSFVGDEYAKRCDANLRTLSGYEDNTPELSSELLEFVTRRITPYSDWHYPGLHFGCRIRELTARMVASDPLYLVDFNHFQVSPAIDQFGHLYQRRLCPYLYSQAHLLPTEQFSIVLSWNLFIYATKERLREYLGTIFDLLRPGGVLMFNYNDCGTLSGCIAAASTVLSYLSYDIVKETAESIGYSISYSTNISTNCGEITNLGWIELKKPGQLSTIKAHQTLGRVI